MKEHDLLWAMLPEGLEAFFDLTGFEKSDNALRIVLTEKNIVPSPLPPEYRNKPVTNTVLNDFLVDDFPVRGLRGEVLLKRRSWKFEGVGKLLTRDPGVCAEGTKLSKDFADFLKGMDRI
ncbi:hypothetical protein HZB69_00860 [Candidatus Amesbacteria bacterium]|nr:hypothetical protein [Candidatus Amesbacteria bacterium]